MKSIKERIEEIKTNGYQLDFGTVFENAFENYKKIALYAGLMFLVFFILFSILTAIGILSYVGIENMEEFNEKLIHFSETKNQPLSLTLQINTVIILLSGILIPFMAGFLKMANCGEKGEEFHVSTMFSYYKTPYFFNILFAKFSIAFFNLGLSILFEFAGFAIIGTIVTLSIAFLTFLTIPLIVFGKLNAFEAIKSSVTIVSKQPLVLLGLIIVSGIGATIGIFGFFIGISFTFPFIYSMEYIIYDSIIGINDTSDVS